MTTYRVHFDREKALQILYRFPNDVPKEEAALEQALERTRQNFFQVIFAPIMADLNSKCGVNDLYMYMKIRDKLNAATDNKSPEIIFTADEFNFFAPKVLDFQQWSPNMADLIVWMVEIIKGLKGEYVPPAPENTVKIPAKAGKKNVN